MSLKAKAAALKARAAKGDARAKAELDELLKALGAVNDDDADAESDDEADAEGEDDDAEAEDEDDDSTAESDDEADAEDEDDDAEAVINHADAKGREALAGQLSLKVARGKLSKADALGLLKAAPRGASSFRKTAGANTPDGVRQAGPGNGRGQNGAEAALGDAMKRIASR